MRASLPVTKTTVARRARRVRRGAAAVEFAVTLPIMVLLLFGTIEYGNYFSELSGVNTCTRSGARHGSTDGNFDDARIKAAMATRTLLNDLGYDCNIGSATCQVRTSILQEDELDLLEVAVEIEYDPLTHALPSNTVIPLAPKQLKARAVYPIIGE